MRRSDLLRLTGLTAVTLDNLARRRSLPFAERGERWAEYSIDDAYRLGLATELAGVGCDQQSAAALLRAEYEALIDQAASSISRQDVRLGLVWSWSADGGEQSSVRLPLLGRPDQIASQRREYEKDAKRSGGALRRELTVNATWVLADLVARCRPEDLQQPRLGELAKAFGVRVQ